MSATTYRALRESGFLILPSERKLQDFSTVFVSEPGFPKDIPFHLKERLSKLQGHQQYHSLVFDEMKVAEEIVYKRHTGEMVGYVHLIECENDLQNVLDGDGNVNNKAVATQMLQLSI